MANFRLKKCVYIVNLLSEKHYLTQQQINDALTETFPYDPQLSKRTFERYKEFIENNFPCRLVFNQRTRYYHLERSKSPSQEEDNIFQYLTSLYDVLGAEQLLLKHKDKIHHTDTISGTNNLNIILQAIDQRRGYTCDYQSFVNASVKQRTFIPLFLTTWEGRWYVVADVTTHPDGPAYTYALERMHNIRLTEEEMQPYAHTDIEEYFRNSYGIQHHDPSTPAEDIILRVTGPQVEYLRARPIHPSQKEIEEYDGALQKESDGVLFHLHLTPCYNFYQQILWHRESIEVLQPQSVRQEVLRIARKIAENYK